MFQTCRDVDVGKETILQELEKCVVLCANCHRKLHYDEKHSSRSPNGYGTTLRTSKNQGSIP